MPRRILIAALALSAAVISATTVFAGAKPEPGVEVQMIVTAADHMNHKPPALTPADITIMDGTITDWVPLDADRDLELFFLIDDSANYDFGSKLEDLRRFIASQPGTVSMGVAWIHDGALQVVENPTTDHQRASRALRAPPGSNAANPYGALSQSDHELARERGLAKEISSPRDRADKRRDRRFRNRKRSIRQRRDGHPGRGTCRHFDLCAVQSSEGLPVGEMVDGGFGTDQPREPLLRNRWRSLFHGPRTIEIDRTLPGGYHRTPGTSVSGEVPVGVRAGERLSGRKSLSLRRVQTRN